MTQITYRVGNPPSDGPLFRVKPPQRQRKPSFFQACFMLAFWIIYVTTASLSSLQGAYFK